jgi:23S rRNA (uracil1939-C5)-methyltransferase
MKAYDRPVRKGDRLSVDVERWDDEGFAVSPDGVAVAGGVPGDRLQVEIEHQSPHGPHAWARLLHVERPSADRVAPACPNVGRCGGCLMQCGRYDVQLTSKQARVERLLGEHAETIAPIVPSPQILGFRNKSKVIAASAGGGLILGAYQPATHDVVDMAGCRVVEPPLDETARALARLATAHGVEPYDERVRRGQLRYVVLRRNHEGKVLVVLVTRTRETPWARPLAQALAAERPEVTGVVENVNDATGGSLYGVIDLPLLGAPALDEQIGPVRLLLSARAFLQINRAQAAALYEAAAEEAALAGGETVVDVYAGAGGLGLRLAPAARDVTLVESDPSACEDARRSAQAAGAGHVRVVGGDASHALAGLARADLVVLDPPRKGCDSAALGEVARLAPARVLYVSCGLPSLARDLARLRQLGYRARRVRPFDFFPHTPHVETLTVLDAS